MNKKSTNIIFNFSSIKISVHLDLELTKKINWKFPHIFSKIIVFYLTLYWIK